MPVKVIVCGKGLGLAVMVALVLLFRGLGFCQESTPFLPRPMERFDGPGQLLAQAIDTRLAQPDFDGVRVAVRIQGSDGRVIYERDAQRPYLPASAIKIIAAAISLEMFGAGFRFETPLKTRASVVDGVLEGDLYLQGMGDPSLSNAQLGEAAAALAGQGITQIRGDLIYDLTFLDQEPPRRLPNARHFYAPPSALTVNYNRIELQLDEGPPVRLTPKPASAYARLDYRIRIEDSDEPGRPEMICHERPWGDLFTLRGKVTRWDKLYGYLKVRVSRPGLFASTLLREALAQRGIRLIGDLKQGQTPSDARLLYSIYSGPLVDIVRKGNRQNSNVVSEILNKDIGAAFHSKPGTREKGLAVMSAFCVERIGLESGSFILADASGLSLANRFSASQFTRALNYIYHRLGPLFVETLSPKQPGGAKGQIRIFKKSGTLPARGVNTMVGYLVAGGQTFTFAILANREKPGAMTYSGTLTQPVMDAIGQAFQKADHGNTRQ